MEDKSAEAAPALPATMLNPQQSKVRPNRKGYGVGRAARRKEEDVPALKYMAKLEKLGPREGESQLAYTKRMAGLRAGRAYVAQIWQLHKGDKARCAAAMGLPRGTLAYELRVIGLSAELLDRTIDGKAAVE